MSRQGGNALSPLGPAEGPEDVGEGSDECDDQENDEDLDAEFDLWAGHGEGLVGPTGDLAKKNGSG